MGAFLGCLALVVILSIGGIVMGEKLIKLIEVLERIADALEEAVHGEDEDLPENIDENKIAE